MNDTSASRPQLSARLEMLATAVLIIVALLVGTVTVWDRLRPAPTRAAAKEPPIPDGPISIDGAATLGVNTARAALILFSDFECPFCARSARDTMPEIDRTYLRPGKALLVWRHYPLEIHKNARKAAEAAECARRQGQFWKFHDWAFQNFRELDQANVFKAANNLGLNRVAFETCFAGQAVEVVQGDVALGDKLGISGTPAWLAGVIQPDGRVRVTDRLTGARPFPELQRIIDNAIKKAEQAQDH